MGEERVGRGMMMVDLVVYQMAGVKRLFGDKGKGTKGQGQSR